jgi:hypothetical protein
MNKQIRLLNLVLIGQKNREKSNLEFWNWFSDPAKAQYFHLYITRKTAAKSL